MEARPSITHVRHEARRLDIAGSIPRDVLAPLLNDVFHRHGDDAIVVIDAAERPSIAPHDLSSAMVAVVRRQVLKDALGDSGEELERPRSGHVPFVVIDRYGTTVVFLEVGPAMTSPGGTA